MRKKVVAICGSWKFRDKMQEMAERLQLEHGYAVITPVPHVLERELTAEEKALMGDLHLAKIDLCDAVFVVNVGEYVGDATRREIEYAKEKGKEIIYLED